MATTEQSANRCDGCGVDTVQGATHERGCQRHHAASAAAVEAEIAGHIERERLAREQFAAERRVGMLRAIVTALGSLPTRSAEVTLGIWLEPEPEALEAVAMLEALGAVPTATCYVRSTGEGSTLVCARADLDGVEFRAQYRREATEAEIEAASRGEVVGPAKPSRCAEVAL